MLEVRVWRDYEDFASELASKFPHEEGGIRAFYGECWRVFDALNALELKSLEEPRYLLGQFARNPVACLTLAWYLTANCGDVARRHIRDPRLLAFIDAECYIWSTVLAKDTPMVNAGMVFCDRHYGGINYPRGGVGEIGRAMAEGLEERFPFFVRGGGGGGGGGASAVTASAPASASASAAASAAAGAPPSSPAPKSGGALVLYRAPVSEILLEEDPAAVAADGAAPGYRACGVRLADGREYRARAVVSNATRWDTFERLLLREGAGGRSTGGGGGVLAGRAAPPEAREMRAASAALAAAEAEQEQEQQTQARRAGNGAVAGPSHGNGDGNGSGGEALPPRARATAASLPESERQFRARFRKAPSFVSLHVGVRAEAVPAGADVHHIVIEDWAKMEDPRGTLFVSVPTL